jgi:hypothetical protein
MKTTRSSHTKQSKQGHNTIPKPEIRDNLDSRKNEEQDDKGDDVTHNKKPHNNNKQKRKS